MGAVNTDAVHVLIVDDQQPFRSAARMVVELADGFEVVGEAETGEDGVTMARSLQPDLVLMDINLPGIDGLEATRQIKASDRSARIVLVLSTYESGDYETKAVEAGASAFISKSEFGPDTLAAAWAAATS
jgi:DNA-binding NarL/FixJ family response regulator